MRHKAWSSIEEVSYCFSWSSVKFLGHIALKIVEFDPNWAFPDCNSSLNSQVGYEMLHKAWNNEEKMPYCFPRSSIKLQGHTGQNITDFDPNWAFPDYRPVAAFKSLRFALFIPYSITRPRWVNSWVIYSLKWSFSPKCACIKINFNEMVGIYSVLGLLMAWCFSLHLITPSRSLHFESELIETVISRANLFLNSQLLDHIETQYGSYTLYRVSHWFSTWIGCYGQTLFYDICTFQTKFP